MRSHFIRYRSIAATALGTLAFAAGAPLGAEQAPAPTDAEYLAKIATAAPPAVVKDATVLAMAPGGAMRTLRTGSNDFTCMLMPDGTPMCTDKNGMAWVHAKMMGMSSPPEAIGFMYMLGGDGGASNTDPNAKGPTPDNHWVKTGPHVMILGPASKALGYTRAPDPDPNQPSVMWAGTPWEHVMIPVK